MSLSLVIGNKNYSSWSMRPWVALKACGIPLRGGVCPAVHGCRRQAAHSRCDPVRQRCRRWSMARSRCGISLAIIEYAAERFPDAKLWPEDRAARARARSVSAEMHSRLHAAAQRMRYEPAPAGPREGAVRRCQSQYPAYPADLGRLPRTLRQIWTVSVRRLQRRGCHVCAGGAPVPDLRHRCHAGSPCVYGCDAGAAGVPAMDRRGPRRDHRHSALRG